MNINIISSIVASFILTGIALAEEPSSAPVTPAVPATAASSLNSAVSDTCCSADKKNSCTMDQPCTKDAACSHWTEKKSCHDVLTKEERHRVCAAKAAAIAADPSLAGKGHKKELCDAICKQDPSMKPIMEKLRKHCQEHRKLKQESVSSTK